MPTYVLLSTLTPEGRQTLHKNPDRLEEVNKEIAEFGCKLVAQYAVLGFYDFVSIVEAPDNETVAHLSVDLGSRGTVDITTLAAIPHRGFPQEAKGAEADGQEVKAHAERRRVAPGYGSSCRRRVASARCGRDHPSTPATSPETPRKGRFAVSRLQGSLAIERASVVHGYSVAASPRWCAAVGLLIMLALSAIAVPAERQWQPGPLESAEPDSQALPTSLGSQAASLAAPRFPSTEPPAAATQRAASAYAKLPLFFVPNAGQTDQSVRYYAQGAGYSFYFTDHKAVLALQKGDRGQALHLRFLGASQNARLEAGDRATGRVNYLTGSEHHTNLPTYGRLIYRDLWPGIDLVFRGEGGTLKYEFHLAPGARVDEIRLAYRGADRLTLARGGDLLVHTPLGPLRDARPRSYQVMDRRRVPVESRYLLGPGVGYGFALGADYDPRRPLVIDPGLVYSTFLGGFSFDDALGIAVDPAGHAYVTGRTRSTNFPTTAGAFDTTLGFIDAFVTKLSRDGSALIYSTYLGGASVDEPSGIAVDPEGRAYVAGSTQSVDFPTTAGAFDTTLDGAEDAFVTKLSPDGSALVYSTLLGGAFADFGSGIAVDPRGQAYITGRTESADFPTTAGAFDTAFGGGIDDAFVTKLSRDGSALAYSTFLGGSGFDAGGGIAVDPSGHVYVTGDTDSGDFPTTAGAFDTSFSGTSDAFVTKLNPTGSGLAYSTFLGGAFGAVGRGIAIDPWGQAYVTGFTGSGDFPTTAGAFDTTFGGGGLDAFVTKLSRDGSALIYSTYLGGAFDDEGAGIAVDPSGQAYVTGFTQSGDFPTTAGAFDTTLGFIDAFVAKLSRDGSALTYSTYLGGADFDGGNGIAAAPSGQAYVAGFTRSADFPTTAGAFDTTFGGGIDDAFVTKLETR